jgi:putative spermidine/putrescine transport system permease protein
MARSRSRWMRMFEELLTLPVAVPGLATALALILAYGQTARLSPELRLHPGGPCGLHPALHGAHRGIGFARDDLVALEEAARSLGANFRAALSGRIGSGRDARIVAGSLMVFTLSVGEFNLTWMLHTPLTRTCR